MNREQTCRPNSFFQERMQRLKRPMNQADSLTRYLREAEADSLKINKPQRLQFHSMEPLQNSLRMYTMIEDSLGGVEYGRILQSMWNRVTA